MSAWNITSAVLGCLAVGLFITDWMLSKRAKTKLQDAVMKWWIKVDEYKWSGLLAQDARNVLRYISSTFGDKPRTASFVLKSMAASFGLTTMGMLLAKAYFNPLDDIVAWVAWAVLPLNAIGNWLSLAITVFFLLKMRAAQHVWAWLGAAVMNIVAAWFIAILGSALLTVPYETALDIQTDFPDLAARAEGSIDFLFVMYVIVILSTLAPSLLYLLLGAVLVIAKLLRPVLQPVTAHILMRAAEDERSVLTLLAIVLGGLAAGAKWMAEVSKAAGAS